MRRPPPCATPQLDRPLISQPRDLVGPVAEPSEDLGRVLAELRRAPRDAPRRGGEHVRSTGIAEGPAEVLVLDLPEYTPRLGALLAELVGRAFREDELHLLNGEVDVATAFASKPFDHMLFTGSTRIGKEIMRLASQNLTPVTLELGGKSPAIVHEGLGIEESARRIIYGKCANAGQTCVAPDYALVPEDSVATFIAAILPNRYESRATLLIEPQTISTKLVEPNLSETELNSRLHLISMQFLSRSRLSKVLSG